jgi:hypothetical protein
MVNKKVTCITLSEPLYVSSSIEERRAEDNLTLSTNLIFQFEM